MKKGFTLIELLAVILILGIITLIAIPTVNNIITEARLGAFKSGNEAIMKNVEQTCQTSLIKGENPILSYIFTNGKSNNKIDVKGSLPNDGYIFLDKDCNVSEYYLTDNKNIHSNNEDLRRDYMLKPTNVDNVSILKLLYESYYNLIVSVNFVNNINIPESAIEIKDPSVSENGKIKSWLVPNGSNYDLYVGSEKKIYANFESQYLFKDMITVNKLDLSNLNTSFASNMREAFSNLQTLTNVNLSLLNTSNVKNMRNLFLNSISLTNIDVSSWNTTNVTDMRGMFQDCHSVTTINIDGLDTSNVTTFEKMFNTCKYLTKIIGLENLNTSKVTNTSLIFYMSDLKNIDLSKWDVSNVTNMQGMFNSCGFLESINISNFKIDNTKISNIFDECINLKEIIMKNSNYNSVNNIINILFTKTIDQKGTLYINGIDNYENVDINAASNKYWNVIN